MALNVYKNNKYKKCLRNNNLIHIFKTEKRGSACKNRFHSFITKRTDRIGVYIVVVEHVWFV